MKDICNFDKEDSSDYVDCFSEVYNKGYLRQHFIRFDYWTSPVRKIDEVIVRDVMKWVNMKYNKIFE